MVRTSYEWITKSQCILNLKRSSVCDITSSCFTRSGTTLSHQQHSNSVCRHIRWRLFKEKEKEKKKRSQYFQLCGVVAVVPLQVKCFHFKSCVNYLCKWRQQLFCMKCCSFFVISFLKKKNIFPFTCLKLTASTSFFWCVCVCVQVNVQVESFTSILHSNTE